MTHWPGNDPGHIVGSGHLDPGYGTGGGLNVEFIKPDGSFASWYASALTLSPDGRATVNGDRSFAGGNAILTARLTAPPTPQSAGPPTAASSSWAPATTRIRRAAPRPWGAC
jgi:hypothetical protein